MRIISTIIFLLISTMSMAQGLNGEVESELVHLYANIFEKSSDEDKLEASEEFRTKLKSILYKEGAMDYPFDSLYMFKKASDDERLRVFNWNVPLAKGEHHYEGLVVVSLEKSRMVQIIELKDESHKIRKPESKVLKPESWYGALYYDIVSVKKGNKDQYVLLGWDGDSRSTNSKVIDVLTLTGKTIRFGAPIFKTSTGLKKRVIFKYAEDLTMSLLFQTKEARIVFDHLAPRSQNLEGQFQYYGPDMSFDALNFKKGKWEYDSNIEFKRKRNEKDKNFFDPRK